MVAVGNGGQPGRVAATALPVLAAVRLGNDSALVGWGLAAGTLGFLPVAVQGIVYVRVPTGQPQSSRGRVLEVVIIAGTVLVLVGGLLRSDLSDTAPGRTDGISHPLTGGTVIGSIADAITVAAPLVVLAGLLAGLGVVGRFRRADGIERQQLKWLSVGVIASLALFPFAVAEVSWLSLIDIFGSLLFVVTLAIPVLRYRLWSIDTIVRRSLAYGTVSVLLALVYVGVAAVGASVVSQRVGTATAAIVIAVAFAPLGSRVQRVVDRVAYGDRSDPYRTIDALDRRLADVAEPGELLPVMVTTLATSLRLPYVAIESGNDGIPLAVHGTFTGLVERWPLVHEGTVEGFLIAAPRRGEEAFDQRDRGLLRVRPRRRVVRTPRGLYDIQSRLCARQDQLAGVVGVSDAQHGGNHAPGRVPEHDRFLVSQGFTESDHVIGKSLQAVPASGVVVAAPRTAKVEIHHLGNVGERDEVWFERHVVGDARCPVENDQRRPFDRTAFPDGKLRPVDVEVQLHAIDSNLHVPCLQGVALSCWA